MSFSCPLPTCCACFYSLQLCISEISGAVKASVGQPASYFSYYHHLDWLECIFVSLRFVFSSRRVRKMALWLFCHHKQRRLEKYEAILPVRGPIKSWIIFC